MFLYDDNVADYGCEDNFGNLVITVNTSHHY